MNALLVDDDRFVIGALQKKVDWEELGITKLYVAYSLSQAQKILQEQDISLLITDIEMPKGSGLDLLSWARSEGMETTAIFLTNHADFHYAQKAIALQSFDYCLKPIEFDKFSFIIRKAVRKIEKDQSGRAGKKGILLEDHRRQLCSHFWQKFYGNVRTESPYSGTESFFMLRITCFSYRMQENHIYSLLKDRTDFLAQLQAHFLEFEKEAGDVSLETIFVCREEGPQFAAVFSCDETGRAVPVQELAEIWIGNLEREYQFHFRFDVSRKFVLDDFPDVLVQMQELAREIGEENGGSFVVERVSERVQSPALLAPYDRLETCLEQQKADQFVEVAEGYFQLLKKKGCLRREMVEPFLLDVDQLIFAYLKDKGVLAHKLFSGSGYEALRRCSLDGLENAGLYLHYMVRTACEYLAFANSKKSVTEKIRDYIEQNYQMDLSRNDLANVVYLNADYAARIFKNEMNISVNNYLIQVRIRMAKQMLRDTMLPVNTVADRVGYGNYSYFTRLFKKETGYTPQDYRKAGADK